MALTVTTLPIINHLPIGVMNCYLLHDDSITGLTYPTTVNFADLGQVGETIDAEAGITEYDNVNIEINEDYSTYTQGFWHKLINEYPTFDFELMFTVIEDTVEMFLFRGKIYRENITETEIHLDNITGTPVNVCRSVSLKLVSSLLILKDVTIADLNEEVLTHEVNNADIIRADEQQIDSANIVRLDAVFASMIKLAYGTSYDVSLAINNSTEILVWSYEHSAYESILNMYMCSDFFRAADEITNQYYKRFDNAYEVLRHLCRHFALIPKYMFGTTTGTIDATWANNDHRLYLNSRGRSGSSPTLSGNLIKSDMIISTSRKTTAIRSSNIHHQEWCIYVTNESGQASGAPPYYKDFDIDITIDFLPAADFATLINGYAPNVDMGLFIINEGVSPTKYNAALKVEYWNYATGAYQEYDYAGWCDVVIVGYLLHRMGEGRVEYERTYNSIKGVLGAVNSQWNCKTTMRTSINDGVTARTFYATDVKKDLTKNELSVIWVEE
jgi:hypothetical protein